jgi:hypothetical protein
VLQIGSRENGKKDMSFNKSFYAICSAGKIDPDFDIVAWEEECIRKKPPPRFFVEAFSR